jgi:hypothetical protein
MAELIITEVTREQLDNAVLPQNHVLCEQFYESEGMKTKSGIIIGVLTDLTYQDADNPNDDSSHVADFAESAMRVVRLPERLYFNPEDDKGMPWETEMELCEEDIVWTNPIETLNAVSLKCEGKIYKIIPYQEIYVAKREYFVDKWSVPQKKASKVIPLNGYVLLTEVKRPKLSEFEIEEKTDPTRGIIAFTGSINKRYMNPEAVDFYDLRVGDEILYDKKAYPFKLERTKYNNFFSETGEIFMVCQRRRISAVLSRKREMI